MFPEATGNNSSQATEDGGGELFGHKDGDEVAWARRWSRQKAEVTITAVHPLWH
jgi:hypothetical protein